MNSTGLTIAGGGAASGMLAVVLMWLTHWPLQPLNQEEAAALSGIILGGAGLLIHYLQTKKVAAASQNPTKEGN